VDIEYHCKPVKGDWNGSGMHCNFSTDYLRETGGKDYFLKLMDAFEENLEEHIAVYGPDNDQRLTGLHETQSIDVFSTKVTSKTAVLTHRVALTESHHACFRLSNLLLPSPSLN